MPTDFIYRVVVWLLATLIITACIMALGGAAICIKLERVPCPMPGLQSFASDALSALLGLLAGRASR